MALQLRSRQVSSAAKISGSQLGQLDPLLVRLYQSRGITDASQLDYSLSSLLPFQGLHQIDLACERLAQALQLQQHIVIVGDYDADGATSTALACQVLRQMGALHVDFFLPCRLRHGYGLSAKIIQELAASNRPDLIITVDNGIASVEGVAAARSHGIDVLVTDHHLPGKQLPADCIIVNPNQVGDSFASKNLAGVGVIFYVMLALRSHLQQQGYFDKQQIKIPVMTRFLDLVALGTVADVVPLDYNNRILVQQGILRMRAGHCRPGIAALLKLGKRQLADLISEDLGFCVGPRLNAAGRLDDMTTGVRCLLADNDQSALALASQLDTLNQERRTLEGDIAGQAEAQVNQYLKASKLPSAIVISADHWHEGVIGLIASRLKEKLFRPTIVFTQAKDGSLKASGRSIKGLHLRDALAAVDSTCPGLIQKFGGHAMAAGLSIAKPDYERFKKTFVAQVTKMMDPRDLEPFIETDGPLSGGELILPTAQLLRQAGPWGQAFPAPLFDGDFMLHSQRLVGEKHLKMTLADAQTGICYDAIAFRVDLKQWPNHRCRQLHIVYRLDVNEFRGRRSLQLIVEHLSAKADVNVI